MLLFRSNAPAMTFALVVAAPVVFTLTFLLTVLSKPSLRTGGVTVGSRPASRTRTLKHHGLCQPAISDPALQLTLPDTGSQGASLAQRHCWAQSLPCVPGGQGWSQSSPSQPGPQSQYPLTPSHQASFFLMGSFDLPL